jgi:hypothetical protein
MSNSHSQEPVEVFGLDPTDAKARVPQGVAGAADEPPPAAGHQVAQIVVEVIRPASTRDDGPGSGTTGATAATAPR